MTNNILVIKCHRQIRSFIPAFQSKTFDLYIPVFLINATKYVEFIVYSTCAVVHPGFQHVFHIAPALNLEVEPVDSFHWHIGIGGSGVAATCEHVNRYIQSISYTVKQLLLGQH